MAFSKGAGAAAYSEKSGRTAFLPALIQKAFAHVCSQWKSGNKEGDCLPCKCSEADILGENHVWPIPITHADFQSLKNNESLLCEVLQNKFGCISTLVSPAREGDRESLQVFRKMLTPGLELSVWKDDLTRHAVDAVVNAANEDLKHCGGLAQALVKAGGPEIQEESTRIVSSFGKVPTGTVAITGPGRLPCKAIIHAVGPRWSDVGRERCIANLQKAIFSILDRVTIVFPTFQTVAIPALSSGIFQFPLKLCTEIIVNSIKVYFQGKQLTSNLKEIHLVSNEAPTVAAFKTAAEVILGRNALGSWENQEASLPFNVIAVNNLTVQIVQGCIELQETDTIVNPANPSYLKMGSVSESILQQAGDEMEAEVFKKWRQMSPAAQVLVVTQGFKLPCQYVFHVLWHPEHYTADLTWRCAVKMCLEKCLELNLTSISFPALGTGSPMTRKDKIAEMMFDEVVMFARYHVTKQLTVKFVILPDALETYKAFSTEMEKRKANLQLPSNHNVPQATRKNQENELKAKSPAINLMGSDREKMNQAQEWIQRILTNQDKYIIANGHILYLGKKEHDVLSQLQKPAKVSISENTTPGNPTLEIKGAHADLIEAVLNTEKLLCKVQEEVARKKEQALWSLLGQWTDQQPKHQDEMKEYNFLKCLMLSSQEIQDQKKQFENSGFRILKVEKIDNVFLMAAFQRKKNMMEGTMRGGPVSHRLFQQVPQQFCEVVSRVGFHRVYSMPHDPKYGAGIYFIKNLKNLAHQVKTASATEKLIYVFEAEVLTGSFCQGHKLNIVPPPLSPGNIDRHDSVVDSVSSPETFVIFSGVQAMPQYLWTCIQDPVQPQDYASKQGMLSFQSGRGGYSGGSSVDLSPHHFNN